MLAALYVMQNNVVAVGEFLQFSFEGRKKCGNFIELLVVCTMAG
jgi:hypothetical protein